MDAVMRALGQFVNMQFAGWTALGGLGMPGGLNPFDGGAAGTGTVEGAGGQGSGDDESGDGERREEEEGIVDRFLKCAAEHYGLNRSGLVIRVASALGRLPVPKSLLGQPAIGGRFTNPISALRLVFGDSHLPSLILGTKSVFGVIGRANVALFAGILAYDATSIGMCAF